MACCGFYTSTTRAREARLTVEAVATGYADIEQMSQDSDLTPLRQLPEFQTLLKQRSEKKP